MPREMGRPLSPAALLARYRRLRDCRERALARHAPPRDLRYFDDAIGRVRRDCRRVAAGGQ